MQPGTHSAQTRLRFSSQASSQQSYGMLRHVIAFCNLARIVPKLACGCQVKLSRGRPTCWSWARRELDRSMPGAALVPWRRHHITSVCSHGSTYAAHWARHLCLLVGRAHGFMALSLGICFVCCGMRLQKLFGSCTGSGSRVRPHEASALAGPGQELTGPMSPHVFGFVQIIFAPLVHVGFQ